jgi:hypothetical protein
MPSNVAACRVLRIVTLFGRPTSPIEIRNTSLLPSGAGAEASSIAPIKGTENGQRHHGC